VPGILELYFTSVAEHDAFAVFDVINADVFFKGVVAGDIVIIAILNAPDRPASPIDVAGVSFEKYGDFTFEERNIIGPADIEHAALCMVCFGQTQDAGA
jgi:hypothetical protein